MGRAWEVVQKQFLYSDLLTKAIRRVRKSSRPVIAISRESGSGGRLIAQLVSKKLHFDFYDRNLLNLIAQQAHLQKEIIFQLDEKKEYALLGIIRNLFGQEPLPDQAYIRGLYKTILTISAKGSAVILGRGANLIIPKQKCLRVRVMAPLATRIQNTVQYEALSVPEARRKVRILHFNRKNFCRKYFFKDISNTNSYDLVINTKYIKVEEAAQLIVDLYRERFRF
jgi:hypothetical protein